jgi:hypothetical protein
MHTDRQKLIDYEGKGCLCLVIGNVSAPRANRAFSMKETVNVLVTIEPLMARLVLVS